MDYHIIKISRNKKQYLDLLLLGDEQETMIDRYLERGDLFVLEDNGKKIPHERSEHRRFFTRRAACGVTFVPENRKITCPFRNLCSFLASSGVPDLPPAASFWE